MSDKYPRTPHLPWSPGCAKEDRRLADTSALLNRELVITEKMDGSNVCLEREQVFARSHNDAPRHASFDALKALHAPLRWQIPAGRQVFGEWLWAQHSIAYDRLPAYLLVFGIRDTQEATWVAWDECASVCAALGLHTVPLLWRGRVSSEAELRRITEELTQQSCCGPTQEGIVIRIASIFADADFGANVAKWVRADHVRTSAQWNQQQSLRNGLRT